MNSMPDNEIKKSRDILGAISMDNTMAQDALRQKNYQALQLILDRQEKEIKKLLGIFNA